VGQHTSFEIAPDLDRPNRDPSARAVSSRDSLPWPALSGLEQTIFVGAHLPRSLEAIAELEPEVLYRGELGRLLG
jgi:hypothetical protein